MIESRCRNINTETLQGSISSMSHLPKEDGIGGGGGRRCSAAISSLYVMPPTVPRLQQHFFQQWATAGLLPATPFLSNTAIVAVAYSCGRWRRCWGLSQHGRSCVYICNPSSEWMNQPGTVVKRENRQERETVNNASELPAATAENNKAIIWANRIRK